MERAVRIGPPRSARLPQRVVAPQPCSLIPWFMQSPCSVKHEMSRNQFLGHILNLVLPVRVGLHPRLAMPRKKTGGTSAEGSSSSTSSEHASVPDRGVSADKMRELTRRHDKLCHSLHSSEPAVVREDLVPERPDYLVMYHNLLSPSECRSIIDIIDAVGLNEASKADTNPRKGEGTFDCQ